MKNITRPSQGLNMLTSNETLNVRGRSIAKIERAGASKKRDVAAAEFRCGDECGNG
jgi:hypothetical protein